ncbi:thiamin pyrophosphokinase 1-like isoform X2 [Halichondria panicea]|uniref:thiamin pyrophosphokinase 1-like isoform X2 n=1 Tax=Halichondria panicea TaxID=6063 RepID=UPI00312B37EF
MAECIRDTLFPLHMFCRGIDGSRENGEACLILLNSNLYGMETWLKNCWNLFSVVACADGGSNTLFDCVEPDRHKYVPNVICGDLDSARPEVLSYYKERGSDVVHITDQDSTDFSKTLNHLLLLREQGMLKFSAVYVINALWGRFDQTMGNIGVLFNTSCHLLPLYLMSEDSLLFLLKPGSSCITVDSGLEEGHCGLVPVGGACSSCTTTGLTWNLGGEGMEMKGLISTSNIIDPSASQVTVACSDPLLWTMSHTLLQF